MSSVSMIKETPDEGAVKNGENSVKEFPDVTKEELMLVKRLPRKLPKRRNDIYVTRKTSFKMQLKRCEALLYSNYNEIFIHGLGAAVSRAMNLALQLKVKGYGSIDLSAQTDTVNLTDDLLYENEELEQGATARPTTQKRLNSAIHIRVFRPKVPLPLPKS